MSTPSKPATDTSRRTFLKSSTAATVGASLATIATSQAVHAQGSDLLRIGLIGCGGRGTGAAKNAMNADPKCQLTVMADAYDDRLNRQSRPALERDKGLASKIKVTDDTSHVGLDAYKRVMDSNVDVVLLCTPPQFRPVQLRAAIEAGKHVFCEKPVAVDAPGVRSVMETSQMAKEKNLSLVSGLCWRYDRGVKATIERIKAGMIGDVVAIQENYLANTLWHRGRKPEWTDMDYQLRNWLYYTWLSGDHIVEQHIHSLDKAVWLMNDEPPVSAIGLGGRQVRIEPRFGHIFDHFAVCYEWANGVKTFSYTRQMAKCKNETEDFVIGTKGRAKVLANQIEPTDGDSWKFSGAKPSMYDLEHQALFAGIRSGKILNNGHYMCISTMVAIMGREACYSGQKIEWDKALASEVRLGPETIEPGQALEYSVAMPGRTKPS
ncbi:MAG TPA: twin-arginine translocation signal domain-containing protein [Planctomycetaceae bacterium]|nr:twin-arginine translocation signal domain-containing protein [Planctomycetaceae bacterium]